MKISEAPRKGTPVKVGCIGLPGPVKGGPQLLVMSRQDIAVALREGRTPTGFAEQGLGLTGLAMRVLRNGYCRRTEPSLNAGGCTGLGLMVQHTSTL